MDRAYEDEATRQSALDSGFIPVVPPKKNRWSPWEYDKELYKRRNEIEGYFRRLKRFRKVFTRYDKLDIIFIEVISIAMILGVVLMWTGSNTSPDGYYWRIKNVSCGLYEFLLTEGMEFIEPDKILATTKIPYATPSIVREYSFSDEQ